MRRGYTIRWKGGGPPYPTDGSLFRADVLDQLDPSGVAKLRIRIGRDDVALGDVFDIEERQDHKLLVDLSGLPPVHCVGAGMRGGILHVKGGAGDDLGASMRGGVLYLTGDAGHRVGGPDAGSDRGMTGGTIVIDGNASDFVGLRMRRGLIAVRGHAGRSPGYRMVAGTVAIGRGPYREPGLEMRRGTLVLLDPADASEPLAFEPEGEFASDSFPIASLMLRELAAAGLEHPATRSRGRFRLYTGDRFELNKGEIWQWVS